MKSKTTTWRTIVKVMLYLFFIFSYKNLIKNHLALRNILTTALLTKDIDITNNRK